MGKMKLSKRVKVFTIILVLIIFGVAGLYAFFIKAAPYSPIMPSKITLDVDYSDYCLIADTFKIYVNDSIGISGAFVKSPCESNFGTIIILHGIASCKEYNVKKAKTLANSGFNCILLDMRAHGKSDGKFCTFGYYEKNDIKIIIDTLIAKYNGIEPLAIMGHSLGGAISIQTAATDKRIKAVCASAVFARLDDIVCDYMKQMTFVLRDKSISDNILKESAIIANFNPFEVNPEEYAKLITQPVFMSHGDIDERINIENGRRVFKNLNSNHKEFFIVKNALHNNIDEVGGDELISKEIEFLKSNLQK